MPKAFSSPNIALIKYWGNRNNDLRLPAADSLSMVLDQPTVKITAVAAEQFSVQSFDANGKEKVQTPEAIARLQKHWQRTKEFLLSRGKTGCPKEVSLTIHSHIPQSIGIASSAAVFSCLGEVYAGFVSDFSREDIAILGRLGSGSGARNSFGGFVALENTGEGMDGTRSRQVANASHWLLYDIILVPSQEEKKVGSTEGHAMAATSPLFAERVKNIPRRMKECEDAILRKDFEKLQRVTEEDALDMHRVMETQTPSLYYLSTETHRILREIHALRQSEKLHVMHTMDAGPTVHLLCTEESRKVVEEYANAQKGCIAFKAKTGSGSKLL
jgi:diphosphomevalonate decarboxylase